MLQKTYTLGLRTGGIMEQPDFRVENIRHIRAGSLRQARDKYADVCKLKEPPYWNADRQTYYGWQIVEVAT